MIKIRKGKLKDCSKIYQFGKEKELANSDGKPPRLFWIKSFAKEKTAILFVAEEEREVIGFVMGERTIGKVAILHELFIKKEHRNKGIGTLLLKIFENVCKKNHLKVILLYGYAKENNTVKFWESHKYKKGSLEYEFLKFL